MCRVRDYDCQFEWIRGRHRGMRRVRCTVCEWEQWTTASDPTCVRARCRKFAAQVMPAALRPLRDARGPGLGDLVAKVLGRFGITEQRWLAVINGPHVLGGVHCRLVATPAAERIEEGCPCASRRARLNRWGDRQCDKLFGPTALAMRHTRRGRWWLRAARRRRVNPFRPTATPQTLSHSASASPQPPQSPAS